MWEVPEAIEFINKIADLVKPQHKKGVIEDIKEKIKLFGGDKIEIHKRFFYFEERKLIKSMKFKGYSYFDTSKSDLYGDYYYFKKIDSLEEDLVEPICETLEIENHEFQTPFHPHPSQPKKKPNSITDSDCVFK